ncbi:hypothetical protein [Streptomyces chartreusis]
MVERAAALISAASALAGVALAGAFTLFKGRQDRLDKQLDRDEQRNVMQRQARREAYVAFLAAYHEVERKFVEVGDVIPPPHADDLVAPELPATEAAIMTLQQAGDAVALEGPPEMAPAADRVVSACWDALSEFARLIADKAGQAQRLCKYDYPSRDRAETERDLAAFAFQDAARGVLGGNTPGLR